MRKEGTDMGDEITISKEIQFDAGHRVPSHQGQCRNLHGHRYRVEAECRGRIITAPGHPEEGMLVDFGFLKQILTTRVHDVLDHGFIVHEADDRVMTMFDLDAETAADLGNPEFKVIPFEDVPTAENIARWVWHEIEQDIEEAADGNLYLWRVKVWETPTSLAYYEGR
jgi:6-pyruvoyltetrahydropterin/6-carboxytetrahydropterin synthase